MQVLLKSTKAVLLMPRGVGTLETQTLQLVLAAQIALLTIKAKLGVTIFLSTLVQYLMQHKHLMETFQMVLTLVLVLVLTIEL